jgi:hypothetical protein
MKDNTTYWIRHFKQNPAYGHLRFKKLDQVKFGYPRFDINESLIDIVDLETFTRVEDNRIPLFIGTQFGLHPWFYDFPEFYKENKIIAVLGKSVLSENVDGLQIIKVPANSTHSSYGFNDILINFKNEIH